MLYKKCFYQNIPLPICMIIGFTILGFIFPQLCGLFWFIGGFILMLIIGGFLSYGLHLSDDERCKRNLEHIWYKSKTSIIKCKYCGQKS